MAKQQIEVEKIQSRERIEGAKLQQQERESQLEAETERHYHETTNTLEGIKLGVEIATKAE